MPYHSKAVLKNKQEFGVGFSISVLLLFSVGLLSAGCAVTPQPYSDAEFAGQAQAQRAVLFDEQEPVGRSITLYEAMARAVKYNLDHRVKQLEKAVASGNLERARYDLLPQIVTSAGYSNRSNDSDSAGLTDGREGSSSISAEKRNVTASIITVWNILDFGVSYNQALQQADQVLISEEWRRKAVQNIVQDVRYAYWRAVSAQVLLPRMDQLLERVEGALARARQMEKTGVEAPVKALVYQQQLLETVKQLWGMRKELSLAKTELATLMNLDPGTEFELVADDGVLQPQGGLLAKDLLEEYALTGRPELRAEAYQRRIGALEVKKALLSMLPGLELNLGGNYDDNKYLENQSWLQAGLNLSWNAFNLLSGPVAVQTAEAQRDLAEKRYMATAMMVLTQVNIAHQRYSLAKKEYEIAQGLDTVHQRQLFHAEAAKKAQTGNELEEIRKLAGALSARMYRGVAFAELQGALGRIFHSCGIDPFSDQTNSYAITDLATSIGSHEKEILARLVVAQAAPEELSLPAASEDLSYWLQKDAPAMQEHQNAVEPPVEAQQAVAPEEIQAAAPQVAAVPEDEEPQPAQVVLPQSSEPDASVASPEEAAAEPVVSPEPVGDQVEEPVKSDEPEAAAEASVGQVDEPAMPAAAEPAIAPAEPENQPAADVPAAVAAREEAPAAEAGGKGDAGQPDQPSAAPQTILVEEIEEPFRIRLKSGAAASLMQRSMAGTWQRGLTYRTTLPDEPEQVEELGQE